MLSNAAPLHVAILKCDSIHPSAAKHHGDYPYLLSHLFNSAAAIGDHIPSIAWGVFDVTKEKYPERREDWDAFIITGSGTLQHGLKYGGEKLIK